MQELFVYKKTHVCTLNVNLVTNSQNVNLLNNNKQTGILVANKIKDEIYENEICSLVGQELKRHYPGWEWYVECTLSTGLVAVRNLSLDGDYGFYIPLMKLLNETDPKLVMLAGGEILERYNMHAGMRKEFNIEKDFKGDAIGDKHATS